MDIYINIDTGEWPVYKATILRRLPGISFPPGQRDFTAQGHARVQPVEKPAGDVVTESPPVEQGGQWVQQWTVRAFTAEEAVQAAQQAQQKLADTAAQALNAIDQQAEQQRLKFITGGAGQALEYEETSRELRRYRDDPAPDPTDYPYLMADQGILGDTLSEIVTALEALLETWQRKGPLIKRIRRQAKAKVYSAQAEGNIDAIQAAVVIDWSEVSE